MKTFSVIPGLVAAVAASATLFAQFFEFQVVLVDAANVLPTNTTVMKQFATNALTFINGAEQNTMILSCQNSFTAGTCTSLLLSGILVIATSLLSLLAFFGILFVSFSDTRRQTKNQVWAAILGLELVNVGLCFASLFTLQQENQGIQAEIVAVTVNRMVATLPQGTTLMTSQSSSVLFGFQCQFVNAAGSALALLLLFIEYFRSKSVTTSSSTELKI